MSDAHGGPVPPRPDVPRPSGALLRHGLALRPPATWRWWEALAVYAGAFLLGGGAAIPVFQLVGPDGLATVLASLLASLLVLGLVVGWLRMLHPAWSGVIGFPRPAGPDVRAGIAFGIGLYPVVVFVVGSLILVLLRAISGRSVQPPEQLPADLGPIGLAVAVAYAVVVAPVGEELFFRGVLFRAVRDRRGFWPGAAASSAAFGLIHYVPGPALNSLVLIAVMVCTGFGLAFIYERRGSLWAPMAAHATFNVIGITLLYALR